MSRIMPLATRLFIKAGILYLLMGLILAFISGIPSLDFGQILLPVYWHMIVVGWITQIIIGVSVWMFPRSSRGKRETNSKLIFGSFVTLNAGLLLRFISEPFIPVLSDNLLILWSITLSAVLQLIAITLFILEIWPRIRGRS